ncbi:MAG: DapH/DapD/GlmU-related protein, partial [Phocaeicola sp.]|nr:DapH/DapD/GlmU-related protein [Phocaeicola sp.]
NSEIICQKEIIFGDHCLLSWDILMMDTDFHQILDENGQIINEPKPIVIGNHVWIGCRNTILKGVSIGDNNIISANSTITRSCKENNCVIGGHGKSLEIIKRNVNWKV